MEALDATDREQRLLATANRQHGVLRWDDLIAHGLTRNAIASRVRTGRLTRLHDRVYAFGHTVLRDEGLWAAALWACAPDAALSHTTAAAFHRAMPTPPPGAAIHITTTRQVRTRPGIVVHRVSALAPVDLFRPHPLVVTTLPRTLVDLADVLPWDAYRAVADGLPRLPVDQIRLAQRRAKGRRGASQVRRLVNADDAHTRSAFERRFLRFVVAHGLPRPGSLNTKLAGHRVDAAYPGLVVELDGRAYHDRRGQMRADRRRDSDLQLVGYRVLRLVWDDLHAAEAARTADRLARMIALAAAAPVTGTAR